MTKNYPFQRKIYEIMLFLQQKQRNIPRIPWHIPFGGFSETRINSAFERFYPVYPVYPAIFTPYIYT